MTEFDRDNPHLPTVLAAFRKWSDKIGEGLGNLERAHRDIIELAKAADIAGAARCFIAMREVQDTLDAAMTELHKHRQTLQIDLIPAKFQAAGVTSFTVDDNRVTISATLSVVMKDKVGGMEWLRANDLEDIIQETVNASTLKATIRKMIEDEGKEPPDDLFTVTPVMNTSVTKVKKKAGTV